MGRLSQLHASGARAVYPMQISLPWVLILALHCTASFSPIVIKGHKLFDNHTGKEFIARGITYEPRPNKVPTSLYYFTEEPHHIWVRDVPYLQSLGVNAIRLNAVDPTKNHDAFMCALQQAGIYVLVQLASDCPACGNVNDGAIACYSNDMKRRGEAVINAFAKYDNVLGFAVESEMDRRTPANSPQWNEHCQNRFLRDIRKYIGSCPNMRKVPVGLMLSSSDLDVVGPYYDCASSEPKDPYENAEWFGLNVDLQCDGDEQEKGFKDLVERYQSSKPVMLTGFGCKPMPQANRDPSQRMQEGHLVSDQAQWLIENQNLQDHFAGCFAFRYSTSMQNAVADLTYPFNRTGGHNLAVGYFSPEKCDDVSVPCHYNRLPLFEDLQAAYDKSTILVSTNDLHRFDIPENRQGLAPCPAPLISASSVKWSGGRLADLKCPPSGVTFKCHANPGDWREPSSQKKRLADTQSPWETLVYAMLLLLIASIIYAFVMKSVNNLLERNEEYEGLGPKWITVLVPSVARTVDTSDDSDESAALLSTKGWNYYKSHSRYHSTSIDSEVREERAFNYYRGATCHQSIESNLSKESIDSELSEDESYLG